MYDDLLASIATCFDRIELTYLGHENQVADVIDQCEWGIKKRKGVIGPWEKLELDQARAALRVGWLRLALRAAEKALFVSELPEDEYEFGFNYGKHPA